MSSENISASASTPAAMEQSSTDCHAASSSSSSSSSAYMPVSPANFDFNIAPSSPNPGFPADHDVLMSDLHGCQASVPMPLVAPPTYAKPIESSMALANDGTLTGQGVLALFAQTGTMMMSLQQAAQNLNQNVAAVKTEVKELRTDFQGKYSELKKEVATIQKSQEPWVVAIARNNIYRSVLYCLGGYGFCTATGFVCGIPYFSSEDAGCDAPDLMVGIHIGLATILVRRWFRDIHSKINVQTVLGALGNLFDNRDVPDEDIIRLNRTIGCRIKVDAQDGAFVEKDLKNRKHWIHIRADMLVKALMHLDEKIKNRTFERPLRREGGEESKATEAKVAEDITKSINSRSPASRDSMYNGPPMKMAFGIPCWRECLDVPAWTAFIRMMQPWIICNLTKNENVESAKQFFSQSEIPLRLLRSFCTPTPARILTYTEAKAANPKPEEKKTAKKTGGRGTRKNPKKEEEEVPAAAPQEEEEEDDEEDDGDNSDAASDIDITGSGGMGKGLGKGEYAELLRRQAAEATKARETESKQEEEEDAAEEAEAEEEEAEEEEEVKQKPSKSKKRKSTASKSSAPKRRRKA